MLVSQRAPLLASLSLTAPPPQPTAGEAAITRLLRALHAPLATIAPRHTRMTAASGAPSFLSAGLPRDRRGRIAQKADLGTGAGRVRDSRRWRMRMEADEDVYDRGAYGGQGTATTTGSGGRGGPYAPGGGDYWEEGETDTPRGGVSFADPGRERDKELLESLRCVSFFRASCAWTAHRSCVLSCHHAAQHTHEVPLQEPGPGELDADEHGRVGSRRREGRALGRGGGRGEHGLGPGTGASYSLLRAARGYVADALATCRRCSNNWSGLG